MPNQFPSVPFVADVASVVGEIDAEFRARLLQVSPRSVARSFGSRWTRPRFGCLGRRTRHIQVELRRRQALCGGERRRDCDPGGGCSAGADRRVDGHLQARRRVRLARLATATEGFPHRIGLMYQLGLRRTWWDGTRTRQDYSNQYYQTRLVALRLIGLLSTRQILSYSLVEQIYAINRLLAIPKRFSISNLPVLYDSAVGKLLPRKIDVKFLIIGSD